MKVMIKPIVANIYFIFKIIFWRPGEKSISSSFGLGFLNFIEASSDYNQEENAVYQFKEEKMDLGAFSVSLSVKDIYASTAFYLKLGFSIFSGAPEENWVILKNGQHLIGLFQGMFTDNMLTFNPGWDQESNELDSYLDVRDIQKKLKEQGIQLIEDVDQSIAEGPSHIMLADPDGNIILIDQHR